MDRRDALKTLAGQDLKSDRSEWYAWAVSRTGAASATATPVLARQPAEAVEAGSLDSTGTADRVEDQMKAAVYARRSKFQPGADPETRSVARQVENATAFATTKGWTIVGSFIDEDVSGAETKRLRGRQRLYEAVARGEVDAIIMRDSSRFSRRDGDEAFGELKQLAQRGVQVWFYQDGTQFTHGDFGSNVMGFVRAEMNAEYRRSVARWTTEAFVRKAKAGHVTGGRVFGYSNERVNGHVERRILEAEAAVVRQMFAMRAAGHGAHQIARALNQGTVRPPMRAGVAGDWAAPTVSRALRQELYRGELVWNKTKSRDVSGQKVGLKRPPSEWLRVAHPELRIVDEALWQAAHAKIAAANALMKDIRPRGGRRADRDSKYLLVGFLRCATCGGGLHVRNERWRQRDVLVKAYACTNHYNCGTCVQVERWEMAGLDAAVLGKIAQALSPAVVRELLEAARALYQATARPDHVGDLKRQLATVSREHERLVDAVSRSTLTIPALVARLEAAETKRRELTVALERVPTGSQGWPAIERAIRAKVTTWHQAIAGRVAEVRACFREMLPGPIRLTPFTDDAGYRAVRFEMPWDMLGAVGTMFTPRPAAAGVTRGSARRGRSTGYTAAVLVGEYHSDLKAA